MSGHQGLPTGSCSWNWFLLHSITAHQSRLRSRQLPSPALGSRGPLHPQGPTWRGRGKDEQVGSPGVGQRPAWAMTCRAGPWSVCRGQAGSAASWFQGTCRRGVRLETLPDMQRPCFLPCLMCPCPHDQPGPGEGFQLPSSQTLVSRMGCRLLQQTQKGSLDYTIAPGSISEDSRLHLSDSH